MKHDKPPAPAAPSGDEPRFPRASSALPHGRPREPSGTFQVHGQVSELVGREHELAELTGALKRAVDYQAPQIVTLIGNQGTGKSRLVSHWASTLEDVRVVRARASSRSQRYSAITNLLRDRLGIGDGEDSESAREKLCLAVQSAFGDRRVGDIVHFLGSFLDFYFTASPFTQAFDDSPRQQDEIARTVLRRFLEVDASRSPLVLIFDDLHNADDETLSLLEELGDGLGGSSVVMVMAARPELVVRRPQWGQGDDADHVRLELRNLDPVQSAHMFQHLLSRADSVPAELVEDAVEMTGGNPFFLEQLVRVFIANGTVDTSSMPWRLDAARALETELPISVEEAIQARIAALEADERDLLEKGAIFGNVFWVGAVVALTRTEKLSTDTPVPMGSGLAPSWRDDGLVKKFTERVESLARRDYLLQLPAEDSTIAGDIEVVFKHNLERELIVKMTNVARQKRYHRIAAQWLETKLSDWSEEQFEFLAQLYEHGDDKRRAAHWYVAGGDKARLRYSNEQAVTFYDRALGMLKYDDAILRMDALHNVGDVLARMGRVDEAATRFQEMMHVAWLFDHKAKGGAAHLRIGRVYRDRGEYERSIDHFRLGYELFAIENDRRGLAGALDDIGRVCFLRGDYKKALEHHRQALGLRRAFGDQRSIAHSLANIGRVHHDSGSFKAAVEQFRQALDIRRDVGDRPGVMSSLCDLGLVHEADGNLHAAREMFDEALRIATETGDRIFRAEIQVRMGGVELALGHHAEAEKLVLEAREAAQALGDRSCEAESERHLAEVLLARGEDASARQHAERARELADKIGSQALVGIAHRVLGEVLAAGAATDDERALAEKHFFRSIEILSTLRNELALAHCYRSFADFRDQTGNAADAAKLRGKADKVFGRLHGAAAM